MVEGCSACRAASHGAGFACIAVRNAAAASSRRFSEARPGDDILVEKAVRNLLESVGKGAVQSWCYCASLVTGMHGMLDL
jgi:hypothetical protein